MRLIFDWSSSFYEEKKTWRGDEEIISLEISQQECGFASAKVSICAKNTEKLLDKKYAKIGVQLDRENPKIDLLFSGRLISFPAGFGNSSMEIELLAEPDDYQDQLRKFSQENFNNYDKIDKHSLKNGKIVFDDLFFSSKDTDNPTIFLEGDNKIFFWNMKTGKLSTSKINSGEKNIKINGSEIIENSLRVRLAREPYKCVNVSLSASWIQYINGFIDLYPMIAQRFDLGLINSFTNIKPALEKICSIPNKNGYHAIHFKINEISPGDGVGFQQKYPLVSSEFFTQENEKSPKKIVMFKRFYFNGKMIFGWNYKQKRTELVRVRVINTKSKYGREKTLHMKLNSIQLSKKYPWWRYFSQYKLGNCVLHDGCVFQCTESHTSFQKFDEKKWKLIKKIPDALKNDSSNSFFKTERGKNAIKYALQKAIALINFSSRYVEISFTVGANAFLNATINDQITIYDYRFTGGAISGKIIKSRFLATANKKTMSFSIACCTDGFCDDYSTKLDDFCNNVSITQKKDEIFPSDIVTDIEIKNPPEYQEEILSKVDAKTSNDLESQLKKHATRVKIFLHPFNTMREIVNKVELQDFCL